MAAKKKTNPPKLSDAWIIKTEIQVNGRKIVPGTELRITGERGRFRFIKYVDTGTAQWIDVVGANKGAEVWRSFKIEQIRTVHYKNQTTKNLAVEYKQKRRSKSEDKNEA